MPDARRMDPVAVLLAALIGATVWISLGALAVTSERVARIGAVAPWWALPVLIAVAAGAAAVVRLSRPVAWAMAPAFVLWLPWLPVRIPPAFLIWEGPLETAVWCAAVLGGLAALTDRRGGSSGRLERLVRRGPVLLAVLALASALGAATVLSREQRIPGGDEPHYLIITQSLLKDGDLRIQNNHDRGDYFAYFDNGLPPDFLQRGSDGQIYSVHAPGISVLLLPAFAVGGYPAAVVTVAIISVLGLMLAWRAASDLSGASGASLVGAIATFTTATMFFHSYAIFPDPIGGAIVAAALAMLVRLQATETRRHGAGNESPVPSWQIGGVSVLIGLLPFLHTRFAVIAAALGLVFAARLWTRADRIRALLTFGIGPAILAAGWFGYFYAIYGTPNPAAPYGNSQQNAIAWIGTGIVGLLVDQQFGALIASPVLVFAPYGWFVLSRIAPRLAWELAAIAVPYTLVVASFGMWWGGWSAPARFLDCLMPLTVPVLALAWRNAGRALRGVFVALILISVANLIARLTVLDGSLFHNSRDGFDLLLDWLSRSVNLPLAVPSVHRSGPQVAMLMTLGWGAVAAIGLALLAWSTFRLATRGAQWGATAAIGYAIVMAGLSSTWALTGMPSVTPESSETEFVGRWRPELRPAAVELPALRVTDLQTAVAGLDLRTSARARDVLREHPLLAIPWLPAGNYRVAIEGASQLAGTLTVSVGQTSQVVDTWSLDGRHAGLTDLWVSLPSLAHSVVIRGDAQARTRITHLSLRPEMLRPVAAATGHIVRSSRFADTRAYFLDDEAFVEPGGVWTRGDSTSRFYLVPDVPGSLVTVDVRAGPVASHVEWRAGAWRSGTELAAGERRRFQVPAGDVITLRASGGFRPIDVDPGADDRRRLGVRLEFPGSAAAGQ